MQPSSAQLPERLERLGRYRIVRPLSKGGMALVYEARRESLAGVSPRVAIKLILPDYAGSDSFQELFVNEARLGASMHHQNLVQIQDFDRDGDKFFLVMEYVEGLTLRRVVSLCARHQIVVPMGVIAEIGRQACDGLYYAHLASDEQGRHLGLVHRDVKPSNLILNPQGVVKLLDFGISKGVLLAERKGSVKGTWGYMAPEQAAGADISPNADVFGLATVLYEMAALKPLFDQRPPDEIKRLLQDDHAVRMATQLDPRYAPLIQVLVRAMQRDPKARFHTAADFGRALSALLPDPITAREEVTQFYQSVEALDRGRPLAAKPGETPAPATGASLSAGLPTEPPTFSRWKLGFAFALASLVVVGFGVPLALGYLESPPLRPEPGALLVDEPAGPAGEGAPGESRPAPIGLRKAAPQVAKPEVPEEEAITFKINRREEQAAAAAAAAAAAEEEARAKRVDPVVAPPVPEGIGKLSISATPGNYEVYIDGRLVRKGAVKDLELPSGNHLVTITAADGRTKSFELNLAPDKSVRRSWDFNRATWRP